MMVTKTVSPRASRTADEAEQHGDDGDTQVGREEIGQEGEMAGAGSGGERHRSEDERDEGPKQRDDEAATLHASDQASGEAVPMMPPTPMAAKRMPRVRALGERLRERTISERLATPLRPKLPRVETMMVVRRSGCARV